MMRDAALGLAYRPVSDPATALCAWCGVSVRRMRCAPHGTHGLAFCSAACAVKHENAARTRLRRQRTEGAASTAPSTPQAPMKGWP